ncbi:MAG: DUF6119 family protein, partial [Pseudonocardiaceae bacterium]
MDGLVEHVHAHCGECGQGSLQVEQVTERLAVAALLGHRHPGYAAPPQVVAAQRTLRVGHGERVGVGTQEHRDEVRVQARRVDLDDLGDPNPGFGIEFAVRCLDEDRITKVRRQVMDARGRTDENSATSGEHIRGFGIEQFGEIVSQISGQIA